MFSNEGEFLEDENTTGFIKYYKGREYAFAALLPKENMEYPVWIMLSKKYLEQYECSART